MNRYTLSLIVIILFPAYVFSKTAFSITLIVNDNYTNSEQLKSMVNLIYLKSKLSADEFTIFHLTSKRESTTTWSLKKKSAEYKPMLKSCDFSLCGTLSTLIGSTKKERSKFYNCSSDLPCDANEWNVEVTKLASKSESAILDKIEEELSLLKTIKKNTSIIFYLANDESKDKMTVRFEKDTIEVKAGEPYYLKPIYSKYVKKVEWFPTIWLSCVDCKEPTVSLQNSCSYSLTLTDSAGCKNTFTKAVSFNVKTNCLCTNESLSSLSDLLNSPVIKFYKKGGDIADYLIEPLQPGWVYEFITKPNCGSNFHLTIKELIYDKAGNLKMEKDIWEQSYEKSDLIQKRDLEKTRSVYARYPNAFFFRLSLDEVSDRLSRSSSIFIIQIDSEDIENNSCKQYISPKLIFTPCDK